MSARASSTASPAPAAGGRPLVHLIGAGPGAADLLTVRAARALAAADVVVHDRLVAPEVLALARADAELIDVGKRRGRHRMAQNDINRLLVALAAGSRQVVRLKGGDPLIFARGGEEALALAAAGVAFEIVPGVTAATACAASAGIPLTHRGLSAGVTFITGHSSSGAPDLDYAALARTPHTLVVYMGLHTLPELARSLVAHGMSASKPAAVIENGGTERARTLCAPLADIGAAAAALDGPALVVIGDVVTVREALGLGAMARPFRRAA